MPITLAQSAFNSAFAANPSQAFASNNKGSNVLAITFWINTASAVTVTDTRGNTWTSVGTPQVSNSGSSYSWAFVCTSCAPGANTVTVNAGGDLGCITGLYEVNMSAPTAENWNTKASSLATDVTASITPSGANSITFAHAQCGANTFCDLGTGGFTSPGSAQYGQGGYLIQSAANPAQCQFTGMGSSNGLIIFDIEGTPPVANTAQPVVFFMGF